MTSFDSSRALRAGLITLCLVVLPLGASVSAQENANKTQTTNQNSSQTTTTTTTTTQADRPAPTTRTEIRTERDAYPPWIWLALIGVIAVFVIGIIAVSRRSKREA